MENRRRVDRLAASWTGSCQLAGESAEGWRDCRIIDISSLGLGITFDYSEPSELLGRLISVNLPGEASSINIRLEGQIKAVAPTISQGVRVGIEFLGFSETERAISEVLSTMNYSMVQARPGSHPRLASAARMPRMLTSIPHNTHR